MDKNYRLFKSSRNTNSEQAIRRIFDKTINNYGGVIYSFEEFTLNNISVFHVKTPTNNIIYMASEKRKIQTDEIYFVIKELAGEQNYEEKHLSTDEVISENVKWGKNFKDIVIVYSPINN